MDVSKISELKTKTESELSKILIEFEKESNMKIAGMAPEFVIDKHGDPFFVDIKILLAHEYDS